MAKRTLRIDRPIDDVWADLQQLPIWEGIAGLHELSGGSWDKNGNLSAFQFKLDTPLGTINDSADVVADKPRLSATADAKGVQINVDLLLNPTTVDSTEIEFTIDAKSTTFLTKALEGTLRAVLDSGLDDERDKLASRLKI